MSKTIVGVIFHDTKVYFSIFEKTYPNISKIKPLELSISFHDGKVTAFEDAYKKQTCLLGLTDCNLLNQKLAADQNAQKYCSDVFKLWVLMMKKIQEHVTAKIEGNIEYVFSIPETNQTLLRDVIFVACKVNEMKILKIITSNVCSAMGFQSNSYYSRREGNSYVPKLMMNINLDDNHCSFNSFYVSRERVINVHSTHVRLGMSFFVHLIVEHILQASGVKLNSMIDYWDVKYRKKINDFYSVINAFSEGNVTKTYYRDDDENTFTIERETVNGLFKPYLEFLSAIANVEKTTALSLVQQMQSVDEDLKKVSKFNGIFFTGEHKNAFVINAIENVIGCVNDSTVNQQMIIADGCGWICEKMKLKNMTERQQATQQYHSYIYERCVDIDSIVSPNTILLMTGDNQTQLGLFPQQPQMSYDPIDIPNSTAGKYNLYIVDFFFHLGSGDQQNSAVHLGLFESTQNNFGIFINETLGNMMGYTSTFDSNTSKDYHIEKGCELSESNQVSLGPSGDELNAERYSNLPSMDTDLNNAVVCQKKSYHGCDVMFIEGEIYNQYKDLNVEEYKTIFATEDQQNKLIEKTAEKAAEIKSKRVKQLIAHCGDGKRKEIVREMNKMIKMHKDNPESLEAAWVELVKTFAPGCFF